jgi:hypothetical protein
MNPITSINSLVRCVALFVLALVALLFGGAAPAIAQTNNSTPPKLVGYLSRDNWRMLPIMDFDYDQQGNLYVLESGSGITRVSKFRPDGTFERTFGSRGDGYGQFASREDGRGQLVAIQDPRLWNLKIDVLGNINILLDWDTVRHQWTKFTPQGDLIGQRNAFDFIDGHRPVHVDIYGKAVYIPTPDGGFDVHYRGYQISATLANGNWVNDSTVIFHLDAVFTLSVALDTLDPNTDRQGGNIVAIANDGTRYILNNSDAYSHIIVLDSNLNRIRVFGGTGSGDVQFNNPTELTVLPNGNIWVRDTGNSRWQEITSGGEFVSENRTGVMPGVTPPKPEINLANYGIDFRLRVDGSYDWVSRGGGLWWSDAITDEGAWSGGGYGVEPFIERFSWNGKLLQRAGATVLSQHGSVALPGWVGWGWPIDTEFTGWHSWSRPIFDVTNNGSIVTLSGYSRADQQNEANPNTNAFLKFYAPDKSLQWRLEISDSGKNDVGYWGAQSRYVRIKSDKIYVFVSGTKPRTLVYDFNGQLVATGEPYPKNSAGQYVFPTAVYGNSFLCNDGRAYEPAFAQDGLSFTWSQTRQEVGGVWVPTLHVQIAVDSLGRTSRVNHGSSSVERTEWDGAVLPELGFFGSSYGQFNGPWGITVGPDDTVYVSDMFNNRVQRFTRSRQFISTFDVPVPGQIEVRGNMIYVLENGSRIGIYSLEDADTTAPITVATQTPAKNDQGWNKSNVAVTLRATDNVGGVGVVELHYTINGGTETVVKGAAVQLSFITEGEQTISYFAVDYNGNSEAPKTYTVKIDKVKPTTTKSVTGDMVTLSATDDRSGILKTYYAFDGATAQQYTAPFPVTGHNLRYWSVDNADNVETDGLNPGILAVQASASRLVGGVGVVGTVTLDQPAPFGGTTVTLSASNTAITIPVSIVIPEGQTTGEFDIDASPVALATSVVITASCFGTEQSTIITIDAPTPHSVTLAQASITGGSATSATILISGLAPAGGLQVRVASSSLAMSVPTTITISAGQMSASINVQTNIVSVDTTAILSAMANGVRAKVTLGILGPRVQALTLSPSTIASAGQVTGTVTLNVVAPTGGKVVTLASGNTSLATVPAAVTVPAGQTAASFTVTAGTVATNTVVSISAATNGSTTSANLTVTPPPAALSTVTLNPSSIYGAVTSTGTVTLTSAAPAGGAVVTLASSNTTAATVRVNVTIPAGATSATFTITGRALTTAATTTITTTYSGVSRTAVLTVNPAITVSTLTLNPTSVRGGTNSVATVTLSVAAPAGGVVVTMSSATTTVATVPATVTVAAGSRTATVTITTRTQTATRTSVISARVGTTTARTATLSVTR